MKIKIACKVHLINRVKVREEIEVEVPDNATDEEIEEAKESAFVDWEASIIESDWEDVQN